MRSRTALRADMTDALQRFEQTHGALPGIAQPGRRAALAGQLADSMRRTQFFTHLLQETSGPAVADPTSASFDPLRAAAFHERAGHRDEAFWLVFLFIHFGKHRSSGWRRIADIYGRLGNGPLWTWDAVSVDVHAFRRWLGDHVEAIKRLEPKRGFGNHRKYESLEAWTPNGTGAVIESYVGWVGTAGHDARIAQVTAGALTPAARFDALYASVHTVRRFGRTGAFDYCSTLAKLGLVAAEPSAACLVGATGPLKGARLLLAPSGPRLSAAALEARLTPLQSALGVGFDVLEDALCNWQKSPAEFKPFRG